MENKIELLVEPPLLDMMQSSETLCVAACCGLDAFDISKEQIGWWIAQKGREQAQLAATQLRNLIEQAETHNLSVISGLCINSFSTVQAAVAWLVRWETVLKEALQETK